MGGAERQVVAASQGLLALGNVTLLSHVPVSREKIEDRTGLGLDGVDLAVRPETPGYEGLLEGLDVDVLINGTYHTRLLSPVPASVKFEYFPPMPKPPTQRVMAALASATRRKLAAGYPTDGWYGSEQIGGTWYRQSGGPGRIAVRPGDTVRIWISDMCADGCGPREYQVVAADGQVLTSGRAGESGEFAPSPWLKVPIGSRTIDMCVSAEASLSSGERRLIGLALGSVESRGLVTRITDLSQRRLTAAATRWAAEESLSNYDCVYRSYTRTTTNSRYTASWLRRWWGVDSEVIEPPVISRTLTSKAKRPEIVSVGRFFTEGHGKKQLDLVAAFRRLHKQDLRGWRLVLIGGADEPAYVDQVRAAARGLPVDIHTDVAEHQAEELKDRASVVWHAAGYGESPARHPGRFEHFGMAVAEGMAAGAVPVVLDGGGLREIVQHGLHGFRWRTIDELCEYTLRLVRDARLREDMGVAAKTHVQQWSLASYQDRVNALVQSAHEDVVAGAVR